MVTVLRRPSGWVLKSLVKSRHDHAERQTMRGILRIKVEVFVTAL